MIEPTVRVAIEHRLGRLHLQANVQIQPGWTVLFGASGSGKSTLLRILAGLIRPDSGSIQLMGSRVCGDGVFVPAHLRPMRWAGQRTALFPNRTVEQNLNYGWPTSAEQMSAALRLFGLEELASARPAELSGGQQQRVAVARAAVGARDKVLLLDEPFSGLDRVTRTATIAAVRSWLGPATTVISVTHDVGEAFELGAAVIRMEAGHVTAHGPVKTVLQAEKTALQATLERGETAQG